MIPTFVLSIWLTGLWSFGLIGGGGYLAWRWYRAARHYDPDLDRYIFNPHLGWNEETALLAAAIILIAWAFAGGLIRRAIGGLASRPKPPGEMPPDRSRQGESTCLKRPDGSDLRVESYGPADGPPIVLTHGWGANSTEWTYLKRELTDRYRLIVWDLPGLGLSTRPADNDYRLENLAADLEAVLGLAGGRPAILLGHSIGGMTTLTFCKSYPEALGTRVAGLVLVHTSYTNPIRTTKNAGLYTALERPLIVPLLHLTIWLSPLVWIMNWLSYLNGSAHKSSKRSGFAGTQTWDQVDFAARFQLQAWPAVLARGMFGMLAYDATPVLGRIKIPTLVIPGDRDPVCKPEASERMHREISGATLAPLAPGKHMGLIEHHAKFAELVGQFADSCQPAGDPARPAPLAKG